MGLKESILEALEVVYEMLELILCTIELMMFVVGVASMSWFLLVVSVREWLMLFVHNNVASGVMVLKLGAFVCCVILLEKETVCTCCSSSKKGLHACGSPSTIYILKSNDEGLADLERLGHLERWIKSGRRSNDRGLADLERLGDDDLERWI
ncbi:uncharacterized protein HKW66_Vig0043950 [Vigna angularis]|uniref:Uncharacterized protein n=1 Tax=Phaseolus angularis TaxID=3914 RepID=A0A8T0KXR1_PHAAN|nr:uncharacterized protein HKW66_Vig0043950 [Vigna angularis]